MRTSECCSSRINDSHVALGWVEVLMSACQHRVETQIMSMDLVISLTCPCWNDKAECAWAVGNIQPHGSMYTSALSRLIVSLA